MARFRGPRGKVCRRLGVPMTAISMKEADKDPYARRPFPPGQHGPRAAKKLSEFGKRLQEKQKLRLYYGILERQMRRVYRMASRKKGNSGENMLSILESRLDAVVMRLGFATTIFQARQLVSHGHFAVNGKKANIPSMLLRPGDEVSVREKSNKLHPILESLDRTKGRGIPQYLELNEGELKGKLLHLPKREEIPIVIEENLIIEYYAQRG
ncbi:MAG: 30S ribosomal protein S4 [Myxococcota bacterium]